MTESGRIGLNSHKTDIKSQPGAAHGMAEMMDLGPVEGPEGHWVVVLKGKVIASSRDGERMARLAMKYPPEDVYLTMIPYHDASFY